MKCNDIISEEKTRLDPACWHNKKIGNPKTKMKGGVRVNNCVPKEGMAEARAASASFRRGNNKRAELNAMSDEERRAYDKEQQEKQRKRDDARLERERQKNAAKKGVAEAFGLYGPFTVTINTGERPQSRTKTKKFKREDDAILWAQDWLEDAPQYVFATAEVTDPEGNVVWTTDESLGEQGVAEGSVDHRALGKHHEEMTDQELRKIGSKLPDSWDAAVLRRKLASHPKYAKALKHYDKSEYHFGKAAKQGVAEGSGDGYYYLQGGIERSKKFASEAEAMAHSKQFFQLARVSRVTLKYKEPGQPAVVVKEFTFNSAPPPKSQMSWGDFYLQNKKQGMSEDFNPEYDDEAGMAQGSLHTLKNAVEGLSEIIDSGDNLPEWCQEKISLAEDYLVTVWDYIQSEKAQGVDPEISEEFDMIERIIESIAAHNGVDAEVVWSDLESLTEDELYAFAVTSQLNEDWSKVNKKDKTDGMSRKAVNAYRREHPGSKLKTAVTTKPSKLKKGSKASKRRKSYCSRSRGQMKMHNISCAKTPDKAICKARRRWNC